MIGTNIDMKKEMIFINQNIFILNMPNPCNMYLQLHS